MGERAAAADDDKPVKIRFVIPGHPPTVNHIWRGVGNRRYKTREYITWENTVARACLALGNKDYFRSLRARAYRLEIEVLTESWRTQKGLTIKKPDTPNMIKAAEDAICRVYDWEDSFNISTLILKLEDPGGEDSTIVSFEFL